MTPRDTAELAADDFLSDSDDSSDDERHAFIAGYLRARSDALKAESARLDAVDRLIDLATIGIAPRR